MKNPIKRLFAVISVAVIVCAVVSLTSAQTINIDRVVAELEPDIQRTLLAGNIPSASIALVSNDRVIWSDAYGYSNLWHALRQRRTPFI